MKKRNSIIIIVIILVIVIGSVLFILNKKETENNLNISEDIKWKEIYEEYILSDKFDLYLASNDLVNLDFSYIAFADLNNDKIPELLKSTGDLYATGENLIHVYTIDSETLEVKKCDFNLFNTPVLYYNNILENSFYLCESVYETHYNKRIVNSLDNVIDFSYYAFDDTYYIESTETEKDVFYNTLNSYMDNAEKIDFITEVKENIDGTFSEEEKKIAVQSAISKYKNVENLMDKK